MTSWASILAIGIRWQAISQVTVPDHLVHLVASYKDRPLFLTGIPTYSNLLASPTVCRMWGILVSTMMRYVITIVTSMNIRLPPSVEKSWTQTHFVNECLHQCSQYRIVAICIHDHSFVMQLSVSKMAVFLCELAVYINAHSTVSWLSALTLTIPWLSVWWRRCFVSRIDASTLTIMCHGGLH